ncbi:MAG: hypothetical protein HWE20_00220 [Gammaproteobacteria bacterium]|nr:hypothetical protein [Gammaproteobacteria bacterium]
MTAATQLKFDYPHHPTAEGYMTQSIKMKYMEAAIKQRLLPDEAFRIADILSLTAANDPKQPIQFWQLYSVVGQDWIVDLVTRFYRRVFADEVWFKSVFERVGGMNRHVMTQAGMWIDCMGGGQAYHGGEYRLNFHHYHNAMELMNDKGAARWVELMVQTLNEPDIDWTDDPRVRVALNTFLAWFMGKYAADFSFKDAFDSAFGETNGRYKRRINFLKMSEAEIEALRYEELFDALEARRVKVDEDMTKQMLVSKALAL